MLTKIIKRDGREVNFDIEKIANAIFEAAKAAGGKDFDMSMELAARVANFLSIDLGLTAPTVEQIQDAVEKTLVESGHTRTAKEFIIYREKRSQVREMNTRLMKVFEKLTFESSRENDSKRENANIDADTAMGTMLKYGSESAKQFYDLFILNPTHSLAHKKGDIHIHDLDFLTLTTTCCQIDIEKLFDGGFCTGHGFLREPNDIQSYSALACIAIQSNQNDQHGGQSIPNFDYGMSQGVSKTYRKLYRQNFMKIMKFLCGDEDAEKIVTDIEETIKKNLGVLPCLANDNGYSDAERTALLEYADEDTVNRIQKFTLDAAYNETNKKTYQAMEALVHNLNTMHSRAGAQIPFSSINYGTDTSPEGQMVIKNVLLATEAGLGNGETPIFPIHIFKVKEGINFNPGEPNYELFRLACRVSAKRLFPNFSFIDAPFNLHYYREGRPETEIAYMGCRTRVIGNTYDPSRETVNGRGNLSFTSINLPRIGIRSNKSIEWFFEELDRKIELVIAQLKERFEIQCGKKVRNYPFLMGQGIWLDSDNLGPDDEVREVLKHGTLTVGFIGLAECLKALIGEHHGESQKAQNLGLEIVNHMRRRLDEQAAKDKLNFSLIATPAEGLSGRFVAIDRQNFGTIEGVTDHDYYTNSFHIPVYYPISAYDKIKIEAPYHTFTNAGHITYVEVDGDPTKNLEAFEQIVRTMKESGIGYGSINHPVDRDPVCGYTGIIDNECPKCGRNGSAPNEPGIERIRRITGYLVGTVDRFNNAKRSEVNERIKHVNIEKDVL